MKRILEGAKAQKGLLALALVILLVGSGLALLQALGGGTAANLAGPLFTPY